VPVTSTSAPVLSYGLKGNLDLFWGVLPMTTTSSTKEIRAESGNSIFYDWIDENVEGLTKNDTLTMHSTSSRKRQGLLYLTLPSRPYNVKFEDFRRAKSPASKRGFLSDRAERFLGLMF